MLDNIYISGVAVQNALPPPHQSQMKVENLARGLEQHIYETADSRVIINAYYFSPTIQKR